VNGSEHFLEAQAHLVAAAAIETDGHDDSRSAWHQRQALVHATLAHADFFRAWTEAVTR
jgi:ectoine hydroxylase-related dioxygenase (phytanoyl-CoA dioxygenase family)